MVAFQLPRWYYYADLHGVAIFQDMPQKYLAQGRSNETVQHYINDMKAMVKGRGSHPCILQWTAFNEVRSLARQRPHTLQYLVRVFTYTHHRATAGRFSQRTIHPQ